MVSTGEEAGRRCGLRGGDGALRPDDLAGPIDGVSAEQSATLLQAAPLPRGVFYYKSNHSLETPDAHADRLAWLSEKLGLQ